MKVQPYPCPIQAVCERFFMNMDADGQRWQECRKCGRRINLVDPNKVALEAINAQQIKGTEPSYARSSTEFRSREESWSAAEHSKGIRKRGSRTFRKIVT